MSDVTTTDPLDLADVAWQFNEAVSLLREASRCARFGRGDTPLADEIDEGLPAIQRALEHAAGHVKDFERTRRMLEFITALADGGEIKVNGIPWREAFDTLNAIVSDPC